MTNPAAIEQNVREVLQRPGVRDEWIDFDPDYAATDGSTTDLYRQAELFFPSLDDLPERFMVVPPRSDVIAHGAARLVRTDWRSEAAPAILRTSGPIWI